MNLKNFFLSRILEIVILCLGILIIILFVLGVGIFIGFKKANFSYRFEENYHRNFAGPEGGFFQNFEGKDFIESHGVVGQIIKIDDSNIIIKGKDDTEKIILTKENTVIKRFKKTIGPNDLKVDEFIVVIGEPNNDGQIEAKFIRVMPPPPMGRLDNLSQHLSERSENF